MRDFEAVIGRAVGDPKFRSELFEDVKSTVKKYEYDLTDEEIGQLENVDAKEVEAALEDLNERISKSICGTIMCTVLAAE
jgi:hypothetical protein